MESDLLEVIAACVDGSLSGFEIEWSDRSAVNVVLAAKGYPEAPVAGDPISGLSPSGDDAIVFQAGTTTTTGQTRTAGGRVLSVVGLGPDLGTARTRAYEQAAGIHFAGKQYRTDIADMKGKS